MGKDFRPGILREPVNRGTVNRGFTILKAAGIIARIGCRKLQSFQRRTQNKQLGRILQTIVENFVEAQKIFELYFSCVRM